MERNSQKATSTSSHFSRGKCSSWMGLAGSLLLVAVLSVDAKAAGNWIGAQGHAVGGKSNVSITPKIAHYSRPNGRNTMNQLNQAIEYTRPHPSKEEYRKLWVEAVEQMAENTDLKKRIDFLERQIATNAFGGWQLH